MANSPQAQKRARQNKARRQDKASQKTSLRTSIKKIEKICNTESANDSSRLKSFSEVQSTIDKAAKNIIHPNKAARIKSRLSKALKAAAITKTATAETSKKKRSKSSKAESE